MDECSHQQSRSSPIFTIWEPKLSIPPGSTLGRVASHQPHPANPGIPNPICLTDEQSLLHSSKEVAFVLLAPSCQSEDCCSTSSAPSSCSGTAHPGKHHNQNIKPTKNEGNTTRATTNPSAVADPPRATLLGQHPKALHLPPPPLLGRG